MDLDRWGEVGGRKHCNQNALYKRNVFLTKKKNKKNKQTKPTKQTNEQIRKEFLSQN